ncbi:MAG: hypothetical protein HY814_15660 [Candidatus Riflebacteria bacterium]|nr:hypothetical protein [Candidatus Riflebacteria bacterium]
MGLFEILATVGFLLGAAVNVTLLLLMRERGLRARGERAFLGLVWSGAVLYCSAFASLLLTLVFREPPRLLSSFLDGIALLCLALQPSLLLHTFLETYFKSRLNAWLRGAVYVPSLLVLWPLATVPADMFPVLAEHGTTLYVWYMLACMASSVLALSLVQKTVEEPERGFARDVGRALGPVWIVMMLCYPMGGVRISGLGRYLELVCVLAPLVPSIVFGYYIYRYNYLGYSMRNTVVNSLLAFLLLCLYIFGIRQAGELLLPAAVVKVEVLEGLLIMGLVFAFSTLQGASQDFFDRIFLRQSRRKREMLAGLSAELGSPLATDPNALLAQVAVGVSEALGIQKVGIYFAGADGRVNAASNPPGDLPLALLMEPFGAGTWVALEAGDLVDGPLKEALLRAEYQTVLPILSREGPAGVACLGRRSYNRTLAPQELDMLRLLLNQLLGAVEKVRIFQQKLALERKLLEDERLASLGMLSASVAHEIKNPLGSIKAIIQVTRETMPPGDLRREDLSVVLEEIDRLAGTVTRLLEFTRPREDEERFVAVERVIERVLEIFSYEARRRSVAVVHKLSHEPHYLRGGLDSLKSVLFNLVLNAFQAMEKSGTLTIETAGGSTGTVVIAVTDTGPGIPEAELPRIFEPFHSSKPAGTGLGLALVRQRVDEMGGTLGVQSGPSGTRFQIELPVYLPANRRARQTPLVEGASR